jgi:hypothetical protein
MLFQVLSAASFFFVRLVGKLHCTLQDAAASRCRGCLHQPKKTSFLLQCGDAVCHHVSDGGDAVCHHVSDGGDAVCHVGDAVCHHVSDGERMCMHPQSPVLNI